jgi:multiple sugar transport system permease protein
MRRKWMKRLNRLFILHIPLALFFVWTVAPIYWILNTALKPNKELFTYPLQYYPHHLTLENFKAIFQRVDFGIYFRNSAIVAVATTIALTIIIAIAGYGYSRFRFKGKQVILLLFLSTQMLPQIMVVLPLFVMFNAIGLLGTHWALIVGYVTVLLPFSTFLMMGFYQSIPHSLDEAAMIDGCSRFQALVRVILPLALPGLAASATFGFINAWNELLFALMFINRGDLQTVPPMLVSMNNEYMTEFSWIAAAGVIALVPVMIMFGFAQKYLTGGLTAGAVKG